MKKIIYYAFVILVFSCKNGNQEDFRDNNQISVQKIKPESIMLKKFTYEDIARYSMASIMGQPKNIIKSTKENEYYIVWYVRKSDLKKFEYKIKFTENNIIWANIDGRWRDSEFDEKLKFVEDGETLKIIQTYSDGSEDIQEYKLGE